MCLEAEDLNYRAVNIFAIRFCFKCRDRDRQEESEGEATT